MNIHSYIVSHGVPVKVSLNNKSTDEESRDIESILYIRYSDIIQIYKSINVSSQDILL